MRVGDGLSDLPSWAGESLTHYLWRICTRYGYSAGEEPPIKADETRDEPKPRQPGEDG